VVDILRPAPQLPALSVVLRPLLVSHAFSYASFPPADVQPRGTQGLQVYTPPGRNEADEVAAVAQLGWMSLADVVASWEFRDLGTSLELVSEDVDSPAPA
jgi:hypothetical protein